MKKGTLIWVIFGCVAATGSARAQKALDHTYKWKSQTYHDTAIRGWPVHVNSSLDEHSAWLEDCYSRLNNDLSYCEQHLPKYTLEAFRQIPFWLELESIKGAPLQYHPSAGWLDAHGYNPAKENSIEIEPKALTRDPFDPSELFVLFGTVWNKAIQDGFAPIDTENLSAGFRIDSINPPQGGFYSKELDCDGIAIKSSNVVANDALVVAYKDIQIMLAHVPNVLLNLDEAGVEFHIIGRHQETSDLPEYRNMKGKDIQAYPDEPIMDFDVRSRGQGGRYASCGEENLLHLFLDGHRSADVCVHEFAHAVFEYGLSDSARAAIRTRYRTALDEGLWKGDYARENQNEFFAELSMWYFGTHGDQGGTFVATGRDSFAKYDPGSYALIDSIYSGHFTIPTIDTLQSVKPSNQYVSRRGSPCKVLFINRRSDTVRIYWIGYDSVRKSYGTITPGDVQDQHTFVSHPFVITDEHGRDLEEFIANGGTSYADIR